MLDYCSCIGHIDLDLEAVKFHTGTAVTEKHLDELGERVTAIGGGKFFIPKFIGFQYGTLSPMCPAHKPVFKAIAEHRLEKVLNQYQYPNANLSNSLKDIEKEMEEEKEKESGAFQEAFPPSLESIKLQCAKIGLPDSEGEKFFNFYSSKGWMVGKTKMKSWTHALTGWRGRWQESAQAKQSAPESIFNLKTVMEAKSKLAADLYNRHATETGLGTDWNDPAKRIEYVALKKEIKALNEKIAGAA